MEPLTPFDIHKGNLESVWLLSALVVICEKP